MGGKLGRDRKSASTRIEIRGTGESADSAVRALIDEWIVPSLVEAFLHQHGLAGNVDARSGKVPAEGLPCSSETSPIPSETPAKSPPHDG